MKRFLLVAAVVLGVLVLVGGVNAILIARQNPLEAVREQAATLGEWSEDELVTLGGGYSTRFLKCTAYGRYRPRGDESAEVYVEIERPSLLSAWRLVTYRVDRQPH